MISSTSNEKIYRYIPPESGFVDNFLHIRAAGLVHKNENYQNKVILSDTLFEYIIEGEGYIEYDGIKYNVKQGDFVMIRSGTAKGKAVFYGSKKGNPYLKLWFAVCGDFLDGMISAFGLKDDVIIKKCDVLELFQPYIMSLSNKGFDTLSSMTAISEIMYTVFKGNKDNGNAAQDFDKMVDLYVERSLLINPNRAEAAATLGISEESLGRYFVKRFNMSYKKYMLEQRLIFSKELLDKKYHTVSEVAALLGFYDQSYFSKQFKNRFGVYPTEYKKSRTQR